MLSLTVETRSESGSSAARKLRASGKIPAVLYGGKEKPLSVSLSRREFEKVFRKAGETSVISVSGLGDERDALIYDVDFDPVTNEPRHADLYLVEKGKKITLEVPIEFVGVAPAVRELNGALVKVLHEIEVEAEPRDLPHSISVDISPLVTFESQIHVRDIVFPKGVTPVTKGDEVVALVTEVKEEAEEAPTPIDLSSIEVEKKGKEETAEEGAAPEAK